MTCHDPAERGVERAAGPDRREGLLRHRPRACGIVSRRASSASAPSSAGRYRAGPAHPVHQRTGGRQVTCSVVRATLVRVDPRGRRAATPPRDRVDRGPGLLPLELPLRASGRGRTGLSRHARRGCRRRCGPPSPAAVRSPPLRPRCLRPPKTVEQRREVRLAQRDPLDAAQLIGDVQAPLEQGRPSSTWPPAAVTQPRIPSASAARPRHRPWPGRPRAPRVPARRPPPRHRDQAESGLVRERASAAARRWRLGDQPERLSDCGGCRLAIPCLPQVPAHPPGASPRTDPARPVAADAMARRPRSTAAR